MKTSVKRIASICMAAALGLCLGACGGEKETSSSEEKRPRKSLRR